MNPRPTHYECVALPLSYSSAIMLISSSINMQSHKIVLFVLYTTNTILAFPLYGNYILFGKSAWRTVVRANPVRPEREQP